MRILFWLLTLAALAIGLTLLGRVSDGYVLWVMPPWRVEMSLNLFVVVQLLILVLTYLLLRALFISLNLPSVVAAYRERRARQFDEHAAVAALRHFWEGRYAQSLKFCEKVGAGGTAPAAQAALSASPVADDLRPLVQQQLDTLATNRMHWHGEVWPQQAMDWTIELENERDTDGSEDEKSLWSTSLSLTTPRLGRVDAKLQLTAQGVRITLATPYGASAADLRDEAPALVKAMAAAGVSLTALQVKHEEEPARP